MSDATEKRFREVFTYHLRPYVAHQDGRNTNAPALLFADADFAIGDGNTFIHEDDKQASEPAIIYVRADALLNALARAEKAEVALRQLFATCTCHPGFYERGLSDPQCQAHLYGDYARAALNEPPVCRAALAENEGDG